MSYSECSVLESELGPSWSSVYRLLIPLKADDESLGVCFILCSSSPLATLQDHPEHTLEVGGSCLEQGSPPSDAGPPLQDPKAHGTQAPFLLPQGGCLPQALCKPTMKHGTRPGTAQALLSSGLKGALAPGPFCYL